MSYLIDKCPACGSKELNAFYAVKNVPVNSVLLLDTVERARSFPVGDIDLHGCDACGFVFNASFDPAMTEYSGRYESTQAFSKTFVAFNEELARDLIARHNVTGKRVLEIGCGDGDFLRLLCQLGSNEGVGYDPAYEPSRHASVDGVQYFNEFFNYGTSRHEADLVVCKMTLEHIINVGDFVRSIRHSVDDAPDAVVFLQVPNARYVFGSLAFWDVYYEHCSYFTEESLVRLFESSGFTVLRSWTGYDDQYLMIEAKAGGNVVTSSDATSSDETRSEIESFAEGVGTQMSEWADKISAYNAASKRVVIWGAGSKAVALLSAIGNRARVDGTVDINPNKTGTYLPGSGLRIAAPSELVESPPDVVIIMNPIYREEITRDLHGLGLHPEVLAL